MSVQKINSQNFETIKNQEKPVLLDFFADWCMPCRMLAPVIEQISDERPDIIVGKINVNDSPELANMFGVFSIPTLVVLKNGAITAQETGVRPKEEILAMLER